MAYKARVKGLASQFWSALKGACGAFWVIVAINLLVALLLLLSHLQEQGRPVSEQTQMQRSWINRVDSAAMPRLLQWVVEGSRQ